MGSCVCIDPDLVGPNPYSPHNQHRFSRFTPTLIHLIDYLFDKSRLSLFVFNLSANRVAIFQTIGILFGLYV